jgi:thioredoxin 1
MSKEVAVTTASFEQEVLQSPVPVVVDFWAEWCVPCRMVSPILEQLADEYEGKLKVAKVNVDEEQDLAIQYSVVSIPTLMVFKNGEMVNQHVGAGPRQVLEGLFKDHL